MIAKLDRWYDLATTRIFDKLRSPLLLALRLIFGWGLFQTGKGKLEHIDRFTDFLTHLHIPMPAANAYFVASLECIGGLLLLNQITKPYDVKTEDEFEKRRKESAGMMVAGMKGLQGILDPAEKKAAEVQQDLRRGIYDDKEEADDPPEAGNQSKSKK